ncbi:tRNA(Ile)-lysidine synthase [Abditibacteriota bacterium]|nr:tRNA(Ile)-lysidine synthase [Abditibacteriota bacterium]
MFDADLSLFPASARVLVAASGGADSMALLFWLLQQERELVVGHVNHALDELRGGACARDEAWLRQRCLELGVPFVSETIVLERRDGHVNEAVARAGRYESLERLAHANSCSLVATAHTASDALEGLVLNIGRGAGVRGKNGFAPSRPLGDGLTLVRPLWRVGRQEVRDWLHSQNQAWLEDESNQSELFRRNRVRGEIVPLLSSIFGRDSDELARSFAFNAGLARDEDAFLELEAQNQLEMLVVKREEKLLALDGIRLRDLNVALARRVLRCAARVVAPDLREIEGRKIEIVRLAAVNGQKREVWTWRSGVRVEWTGAGAGNRLRFWRV